MYPHTKEKFWRDVLYTWAQYNFLQPLNQEQVLEQALWLNSAIHVQYLPTINIRAIKRGMLQIKDILHENGTFLAYEGVCLPLWHL